MSFVFPILLGGLVLAGAPILLHLIMRQKPRTLPFPAFRFLVQNQRTNQRRLRLRHLFLLLLRVGLIALIVLSLARTRLLSPGLSLSSDSPVSAILVFDTSASMDYRLADGKSSLDEAKRRALELLNQFPADSRVLVLDTGTGASLKIDWLKGTHEARNRIEKITLQPISGAVTEPLAQALTAWQQEPKTPVEGKTRPLPRLLCVFSDRTPASWRAEQADALFEQADALQPRLEGLEVARSHTASLLELLGPLRERLPPASGQDYSDQTLKESLAELKEKSGRWQSTDFPLGDVEMALVRRARKATRDLLARLDVKSKDESAETYRQQVVKGLGAMADALRGFHAWWIDVGTETPRDFGIMDVEFPRGPDNLPQTTFSGREPVVVKVQVAAQGTDYDTTVSAFVGRESVQVPVRVSAGQKTLAPLELNLPRWKLKPGAHPLEIRWPNEDSLAGDNRWYATLAIEEPKRILILADDPATAEYLERALARYATEVRTPAAAASLDLASYHAVYLLGLASPEPGLWGRLEKYLREGGNVGVIPGGDEMRSDAYDDKLLPGRWKKIVSAPADAKGQVQPVLWNLGQDKIYEHPMLAPWKGWIDSPNIDFIRFPTTRRGTLKYWDVEPLAADARTVVSYDDDKRRSALLERKIEQGRVLQFTTPLGVRAEPWHNYYKESSFYLAVVRYATRYLVGEAERREYQFTVGKDQARAWLPPGARFAGYLVRGEDTLLKLPPPSNPRVLDITQPLPPGNYVVQGVTDAEKQDLTRFSVNLPAEEWDLRPLTNLGPDLLLGMDSRISAQRQARLSDLLQGRWSEPVDLFPYLMLGLLLFLALENLLANRFYQRRQDA